MSTLSYLLLPFLRVALGIQNSLTAIPSKEEWHTLFIECKRQALLGIGFVAVEELHKKGITCPKTIALQWAALAQQIKARNRQMTEECRRITDLLREDGFESCILKGQGNLMYYPYQIVGLRQSGDIDVWVTPVRETSNNVSAILSYAEQKMGTELEARYHHADISLSSITNVELHYRLAFLCAPWRNYRFQKWGEKYMPTCMQNKTAQGFATPTTAFNTIYQLLHIYRHFFEDGIGLRQLMDYYFVLKKYENERNNSMETISLQEVQHTLKYLGLWKFSQAVMWTLAEAFEEKHEDQTWMIVPENEKDGEIVLQEIMMGGNFGQYDERDGTIKSKSVIYHAWWKSKRLFRFALQYPEEVFCELPFRIWHYFWRKLHLWKL